MRRRGDAREGAPLESDLAGVAERLRLQGAALEAAANAVMITDREGSIAWVNEAFARLTGWSLADCQGKTPRILKSGQHDRRLYEELWRAILAGEVWQHEMINRRKDGTTYIEEQTITPVRDEQGRITHFVAIKIDVSEKRRAEQALWESEARYRVLAESVSDGILIVEVAGPGQPARIAFANAAAERIFGYPRAELQGRELTLLIPPSLRERHLAGLSRYLETGEKRIPWLNAEQRALHKSGREIPIELSYAELKLDGRHHSFVGTVRDISERKLAEERQAKAEEQLRQSQKLEAIGRLAGGVAHDFNNMLGVITGYGELMRRQLAEDHPARRRLEEVLKAAERAAGLTRQLLAFGRKQVMQTRRLDLNELVRDMHKMFERVVGEDVEIAVREAAGLGIVRADPTHVEQVLMNLVVNARDAMPGGGRLTLETANVDFDEEYALAHPPATPGRFVMLAVSDTGLGMDAETQRQIFEPFFTTKPAGEGTGLGLATVYGIVKQSGGYIWVYSEPGRGTTFKVYLPRVEQVAESEPARRPAGTSPRGHETVLLVEDTETLREMICELLQEQGYTVLAAAQGEAALALAASHERPIDLLLTDVVMPRLGGADLARQIAERQPGIRVLYMSGYAEGAISRLGTLPEGALLLEKPFTNERLVRAVREALQQP